MSDQASASSPYSYFKDESGTIWLEHPTLSWCRYEGNEFHPSRVAPVAPVPYLPPGVSAQQPPKPSAPVAVAPAPSGQVVHIPHAKMVGESGARFNLVIKDGVIGLGVRTPNASRIALSAGTAIRFETAIVKKSRKGKALAFGVLALAAKGQQNAALMTIGTSRGSMTYEVAGLTGPELAAKLRGPLAALGIRV